MGLLGDDAPPSAAEMQEFERFLATNHFPPNPYRALDNSLPTDLPLPGHFASGRFLPEGTPLPKEQMEKRKTAREEIEKIVAAATQSAPV